MNKNGFVGFHQIELDHLVGEMPVIITYADGAETKVMINKTCLLELQAELAKDKCSNFNLPLDWQIESVRPALTCQVG